MQQPSSAQRQARHSEASQSTHVKIGRPACTARQFTPARRASALPGTNVRCSSPTHSMQRAPSLRGTGRRQHTQSPQGVSSHASWRQRSTAFMPRATWASSYSSESSKTARQCARTRPPIRRPVSRRSEAHVAANAATQRAGSASPTTESTSPGSPANVASLAGPSPSDGRDGTAMAHESFDYFLFNAPAEKKNRAQQGSEVK